MIVPWLVHGTIIKPKLRKLRNWYLNALAYLALVTATLSALFLPAIGLFPVNSCLDTHCKVAACYFFLTLSTHIFQLVLYYCLYKSVTDECEWRESVRKWGLQRAILVAIALPYFVQTAVGVNTRYIPYDECMARIERTCPGFTKAAHIHVQKYPWRRRNGKSLSEPYECPIPWDEFERIPEGEPMEEIKVTTLQSYAACNITGNLLTVSQAICIFAMTLVYVTFYFDFVFAKSLQRSLLP